MPSYLLDFVVSVSAWVVDSESLGLVVLGSLFFVLAFLRSRANRPTVATKPRSSVPARTLSHPGSPLAAHQGR